MTLEQVKDLYTQKFGGVPLELMLGMSDDEIKQALLEAVEKGEEILPKRGVIY